MVDVKGVETPEPEDLFLVVAEDVNWNVAVVVAVDANLDAAIDETAEGPDLEPAEVRQDGVRVFGLGNQRACRGSGRGAGKDLGRGRVPGLDDRRGCQRPDAEQAEDT